MAASTRAAQAKAATVVKKAVPTKRAAPAQRNVRGRRGGLKDMPNMPLDILFEVRLFVT